MADVNELVIDDNNPDEIFKLVEFIFYKNKLGNRIQLDIDGITKTKDLFMFFFEILCKGLVLLYGNNGELDIENITIQQLEHAIKMFRCAYVDTQIKLFRTNSEDGDDALPLHTGFAKPLVASMDGDDKNDLSSYVAFLTTPTHVVEIRFAIMM